MIVLPDDEGPNSSDISPALIDLALRTGTRLRRDPTGLLLQQLNAALRRS